MILSYLTRDGNLPTGKLKKAIENGPIRLDLPTKDGDSTTH